MTKQNVVVPEAMRMSLSNSSPLFPYPPPRGGSPAYVIKRLEIAAGPNPGGGGGVGASNGAMNNVWVDSMKASSPTHIKAAAALSPPLMVEDQSSSWLMDHPSALDMFDEIVSASDGKQIVVFLDYDGTLCPIVDDPDRAFMSDGMRSAVRSVARYFPTAIVSGRCRDNVYNFVQLAELYYAGSHGMDIKGPAKARAGHTHNTEQDALSVLFQPATDFLPMIEEVYKALVEKTMFIQGSKVENHRFCVSVHYRCVDEKSWYLLAKQVKSVLKLYPKLRLTHGRKVLEIRPTIKWDKGKALEFLLDSLGFANCKDVLPLYIGDDRTDEDAFKVLRDRGQGFGILVSTTPKETNASYSLQEPSEVMDFLHRLVEWKRLLHKARKKKGVKEGE